MLRVGPGKAQSHSLIPSRSEYRGIGPLEGLCLALQHKTHSLHEEAPGGMLGVFSLAVPPEAPCEGSVCPNAGMGISGPLRNPTV